MANYAQDSSMLAGVASVIAGFSIAMLFFRIQRELAMEAKGLPNWIPYSDWLLLAASAISLLLVIEPLLLLAPSSLIYCALPAAACAGASVLVAGYPFAILAHYRFLLGRRQRGRRENPEPAERWIVWGTVVASLTAFVWAALRRMS